MEERLQKILAQAGFGSRRACEVLIAAGRVQVNGHTAVLGEKADPLQDRITVDLQPVQLAEPLVYVALNKPRNVLSTVSADDERPTVLDLVNLPGRLYPVGRLDVDSEGLILLTNDGDLANRLTHPRYGHEKEYRVLVARRPDEEQLNTWRRGVVLEDGYQTEPAEVYFDKGFGKGAWLRVILREGRKRQIRETGRQIGLPVVKILRVRIGSLQLGGLKPREWRYLTDEEVEALKGKTRQGPPAKAGAAPGKPGSKNSTGRAPGKAGQAPGGKAPRRQPGGPGPGRIPGKGVGGNPQAARGRPPTRGTARPKKPHA